MADTNLSSFIWSVADLLRGNYKQSEYGKVILPFTVLRRLDCVLEPTKAAVLAEKAKRGIAACDRQCGVRRIYPGLAGAKAPTASVTRAAANGTIAGPIHLGEYLTARFTARRHAYTTAHTRIRVPTGPPLAT
jgi:type I restriction-modification system DNA methylase subunit